MDKIPIILWSLIILVLYILINLEIIYKIIWWLYNYMVIEWKNITMKKIKSENMDKREEKKNTLKILKIDKFFVIAI